MGIFGNLGNAIKGVDWGNVMAGLQSAGAISQGDYGTAAQIQGLRRQQKDEREQQIAAQQQHEQLIAAAVQAGIPEQQARALPPQTLAAALVQRTQPQGDDTFERALRGAGIDPASPQGRQLYAQRAATLASPAPQMIGDPQRGYQFITPPAPQIPSMAPQQGGLPTVTDEASYNAVPPGGQYRDPDGHIRTKGGGAGNGASNFP